MVKPLGPYINKSGWHVDAASGSGADDKNLEIFNLLHTKDALQSCSK